MPKSIEEINQKIREGRAVVITAEEAIQIAKEKGIKRAAEEVDVVTTGTFAPMCSSGIYFNLKQSVPKMKLGGGKIYVNGVPAYAAHAAADAFLGATALPESDPKNEIYPGEFSYGGAHVIEDLVAGKEVFISAEGYGTDCYPRKKREVRLTIHDLNNAVLFNPRNCYQNYNVAVNLSKKTIYTYMGVLGPRLRNANYCSAGQLSPLLNDPYFRTIGIGTRIFIGGTKGYVVWSGTQHTTDVERTEKGIPIGGAGTIATIGNLKEMSTEWIRAVSVTGYGASLAIGIGIPIPIIDEEIFTYTAITDKDIFAPVVDYSRDYPHATGEIITTVNYQELRSGKVRILNKDVPTGSLSSYLKAREIASILKDWIQKGNFLLTERVSPLPDI